MIDFEQVLKNLRCHQASCDDCSLYSRHDNNFITCSEQLARDAGDAIEALIKENNTLKKKVSSLKRKVEKYKLDASWEDDIRRGQVQGMW